MIHEIILTTLSPEGRVHIAPFGIRWHGGQVLIAPFRPSQTLDNLLATRHAVINYTDDVRVFAGSLTGHGDWPLRAAAQVQGNVLAAALSHQELELVEVKEDRKSVV